MVGKGVVAVIVDRIVRFHAGFELGGIFFADDRFGIVIDRLTEGLKVLVLDDAGIRYFVRGVVNNSVALVVWGVFNARLERDCTPIKTT